MKIQAINILIVDDHDLIIQGLKRVIDFDENINIVGEANNGEKALAMVGIHQPDVVLLDMKMPVMDGIEVLKKIKSNNSNIKVIILTVEDDKKMIKDALNNGADGYLLKESVGKEIVEAIHVVYKGENYIDRSLVSLLFSSIREKEDIVERHDNILDVLTKRELEVLLYISNGFSNQEIGDKLYLSEKTIKNYATKLFRKLKVKDRVHATIVAIKNDIEEYYNKKNVKKQGL